MIHGCAFVYLEKVNTYSRTIEGYLTDLQAVFNLLQKGDGNPHFPLRMDVENSHVFEENDGVLRPYYSRKRIAKHNKRTPRKCEPDENYQNIMESLYEI